MFKSTNKIAVTMGDPKGVGPEIVAMIATDAALTRAAQLTLFADPVILDEAATLHHLPPPATWTCEIKALTQDPHWRDWSDEDCGRWSRNAVAQAVAFCLSEGAALVTSPINKSRWKLTSGTPHGHTEYLQELTHTPIVGMMMAGPRLRTVPVTIHIPLTQVPGFLTIEKIVSQTALTAHFLQSHFKIATPRIAVTGLNPHAGEQGSLGSEEISIIEPAIRQLQQKGLDVSGPFPADGLFAQWASAHGEPVEPYDAIICMYHDQAMIPVKTLDFQNTVNITMGLPFVRTSPDHGTAEDIAWQRKVNPQHMRTAVEMAINLTPSPPQ